MRAFLLAGGFATRLWPLTEKRAKPLLPLAGVPLLTRIAEDLPRDMKIAVSTNAAFGEAFRAWAKGTKRPDIDVIVEKTTSDDTKLGALGAVSQWVQEAGIDEDVLLLTGDNYFGFTMENFLAAYRESIPLVAAYDIKDPAKASAFGTIIVDAHDSRSIRAFEEKPAQPRSSLVSTGCSVIPRAMLPILREHAAKKPDNVGGLFEELLRREIGVDCFRFEEPWFDIGSFDAYLEATSALVGQRTIEGEGVTQTGSRFGGSVVLGKNCTVTNSFLKDVVLFDGCVIEDCVLEHCVIDENCHLTHADLRRQMLRAGTTMTGEATGLAAFT